MKDFIANALRRSLYGMFPELFILSPKHKHWFDFGYPDQISFEQYHQMYERNGIAKAGIRKPVNKTWQDRPFLLEEDDDAPHDETDREKAVRLAFKRLQFWQKLQECDWKARVGDYGALIFRFADGLPFKEPVGTVTAGLNALVEVIPCFQAQLKPMQWDTNELSPTYGEPTMYQFTESAVMSNTIAQPKIRSFEVHPDRVHIWSGDSTVFGEPALKAGYNDLLTIEKIIGSGGEGFWKIAKLMPIMNLDPELNLSKLATALGITDGDTSKVADKLDERIEDWVKGADKSLMVQGIQTDFPNVQLPLPAEFVLVALQSFAASIEIPLKVLVGSQTGERASTEDADEWARTIMARRQNLVIPNIERIVEKLVNLKVIPRVQTSWVVDWTDLTEANMDKKIERASKMAEVNAKLMGSGESGYTGDEIRAVTGHEPREDEGDDLEDDIDDEDIDDDEGAGNE